MRLWTTCRLRPVGRTARCRKTAMTLDNNVIISIRSQQDFVDQERETVELVTEGRLEDEGEAGYTLSYQESEITGMEGTLTTIQVEKNQVTLMRVGMFNDQMVFAEGRRHLSMYNTPYGSLSVAVNTRKLQCDLDNAGGDIQIKYAIEINHTVAGENLFHIQVREKKPLLRQ